MLLLGQRDRLSQRLAIKISDIEHSSQISVTQISHRIRNFILPLQRICKLFNQSDFAVLTNDLENRVRWKLDGWKSERRKSFFIESKEHSNRQEKNWTWQVDQSLFRTPVHENLSTISLSLKLITATIISRFLRFSWQNRPVCPCQCWKNSSAISADDWIRHDWRSKSHGMSLA